MFASPRPVSRKSRRTLHVCMDGGGASRQDTESVVGSVRLIALVCTDRAVTNYSDTRLLMRAPNRVVRLEPLRVYSVRTSPRAISTKRIVEGRPVHEVKKKQLLCNGLALWKRKTREITYGSALIWNRFRSSCSPAFVACAPRLTRSLSLAAFCRPRCA